VNRLSAFVQPQVLLKDGNGHRDRVRPANLLKLGPDLALNQVGMVTAVAAPPAPLSGLIVSDVIAGLLFARIFAGTDRPVFADPVRAAGGCRHHSAGDSRPHARLCWSGAVSLRSGPDGGAEEPSGGYAKYADVTDRAVTRSG